MLISCIFHDDCRRGSSCVRPCGTCLCSVLMKRVACRVLCGDMYTAVLSNTFSRACVHVLRVAVTLTVLISFSCIYCSFLRSFPSSCVPTSCQHIRPGSWQSCVLDIRYLSKTTADHFKLRLCKFQCGGSVFDVST